MSVLATKETIHIYYEREEERQPFAVLALLCAMLCLLGVVATALYSAQHPYYEHERLAIPAQFLPLKVFRAEAPIIPTGVKTYPATYAHGFLTFSNGSIIGQSIPAGFTVDGAMTDRASYVPPATANGFGMSTVSAHLLASGINMSTLAINEVIGSSLFIRNLTAFTGGHPAYSVTYERPEDRVNALNTARSLVAVQKAQIQAFLAEPCKESTLIQHRHIRLSWRCQFVTYKVPSSMHVFAVRFTGKSFLVDVSFAPLPKPNWVR